MAEMNDGQGPTKASRQNTRLLAIDALRGWIMVFMALDHTSQFVAQQHSQLEYWGGPFPIYHDAIAFLTRLATHPCAPGFFFLMGVGMVLFARSRREHGWSDAAITRHFWARGALLIALKLLVVNRAWELSPGGWELHTYIGVLFALGGAMILGSLFLRLEPRLLLGLAAALFIGTELVHPDPGSWGQRTSVLERLLLTPGGDLQLWSNYPILPWLELVTFGMLWGHWLLRDSAHHARRAFVLGVGCLAGFALIRSLGGLGNIRPRSAGDWIGFLNVVKYPPSWAFTLLTMGLNLLVLSLFCRAEEKWPRLLQPLAVLGQVPLFFYVTHLFLYAAIGSLLAPRGTSIVGMYPYWLLGVAILYPLCLAYGRLRQQQPAHSILHLL